MILDEYTKAAPSAQNAVDIFKGEWSSALPDALVAGNTPLFVDPRIDWAISQIGGIEGKHILELGPLEAGHTYMLEKKYSAASITAIESNSRAFLKCLIIKEIFALQNTRFLHGDFTECLTSLENRFYACIASGVLYHMTDPVGLLKGLADSADKIFLWTHYYDHSIISGNPLLRPKFTAKAEINVGGYRCNVFRQEYQSALGWGGFCGGSSLYSHWMQKEDIIGALVQFGMTDIRLGFEDPYHQNGPAFALTASRK
jgi:hypothetical protein